METVIKDLSQTKSDFKVLQKGDLVQSLSKTGTVFHYIALSYTSQKIFLHAWEGYRSNEQFKEVLSGHFLDLLKKHKCPYMLTDISKMTGTFADSNDWLATVFTPQLISLGVTKHAVVLPSNIFAELSAKDWETKIQGFTTHNFNNRETALKWF